MSFSVLLYLDYIYCAVGSIVLFLLSYYVLIIYREIPRLDFLGSESEISLKDIIRDLEH